MNYYCTLRIFLTIIWEESFLFESKTKIYKISYHGLWTF